ncbi:hypothetical protein HMSSN036_82180 [Paenibacillus macerans]|nr:hypothetical protein HMSSN036_82180 [Paenibacillus macerans]
MITIAGGKLTGYRKMAETIVDLVMRLLSQEEGLRFVAAKTKNMPISGGHVGGSDAFRSLFGKKARKAFAAVWMLRLPSAGRVCTAPTSTGSSNSRSASGKTRNEADCRRKCSSLSCTL